jgi:signal transduction histidine kinase
VPERLPRWLSCLLVLLCLAACSRAPAPAAAAAPPGFAHIEAARSPDWHDEHPPAAGWVAVSLPDRWQTRWPGFAGVVWYRLRWTRTDTAPARPPALLVENLSRLGEVSLNGSLLMRRAPDAAPSLQAHGEPRYWLLAAPMLRQGGNTLLVRVPGLAAYDAGLDAVRIGDAARLQAGYDRLRAGKTRQLVLAIMQLIVSSLFLAFWLMRRRETVYGWYSLNAFCSFGLNLLYSITDGLWFSDDIHLWHRAGILLFALTNTIFVIFMLRLCDLRRPRAEAGLWLILAGTAAAAGLVPPPALFFLRAGLSLYLFAIVFISIVVLFRHTWRTWGERRIDLRILSLFFLLSLLATLHDQLTRSGWADFGVWYTWAELLGVTLMLAWRFADSLRRIDRFNIELTDRIAAREAELTATHVQLRRLERDHALDQERRRISREIHDGMGSTLVGALRRIEHGTMERDGIVRVLRDCIDDLKLSLDSLSVADPDLLSLLATLRFRLLRRLQAAGIVMQWDVADVPPLPWLDAQGALHILRIVQEVLANILGHTPATRIAFATASDAHSVTVTVRDNGGGAFTHRPEEPAPPGPGRGLANIAARAAALGATCAWQAAPEGGIFTLHLPRERGADAG